MTEPKFTSGDWEQWGTAIYSPGRGVICELSELHPESGNIEHTKLALGSASWDEAMANGKLITIAPKMYHYVLIHATQGDPDAVEILSSILD